jgi:hypothetical protein
LVAAGIDCERREGRVAIQLLVPPNGLVISKPLVLITTVLGFLRQAGRQAHRTECGAASLRSSRALTNVKMAVLAPMPSASVKKVTMAKPGLPLNVRKLYRISLDDSTRNLIASPNPKFPLRDYRSRYSALQSKPASPAKLSWFDIKVRNWASSIPAQCGSGFRRGSLNSVQGRLGFERTGAAPREAKLAHVPRRLLKKEVADIRRHYECLSL